MKFAHFSHIWAKPGMTPHQRYEQLWRELALCDELGFDQSFCVEHHFRPDESWMSSPSLYAVGAGARTSGRANHQLTQEIFRGLDAAGHIEARTTEQAYSPTDKRFLPDRYVVGICPYCRQPGARGDQC